MRTSFPTKNLFTNWKKKKKKLKYLEWRANGGKMNTETLPDGYVEAYKKILGGIENE